MANIRVLLCVLCLFVGARSFNLDVFNYNLQKLQRGPGDRPSMFGFTVAAHKENRQSWIMVGAPEAQSDYQSGVEYGGAVYQCDPSQDNSCRQIPFDTNGSLVSPRGYRTDDKSYQWFGAAISSGGEDKPFVACAPRYVHCGGLGEWRDPVGTCYVAKRGFTEFLEYAPCRTRSRGYNKQGYCQAGFGAAISKDGERLYIGAPGSWYWQGQLFSINPTVILPYLPPRYKEYGEGQLYSYNVEEKSPVLNTLESSEKFDNSYLGYSVIAGNFYGNGEQGVAVGMPRSANHKGEVILFNSELKNFYNVSGNQTGGYFGYSLATADVDGDGLDDLIIGAPFYTANTNEGKYDTGRVYIFYQSYEYVGRFIRSDVKDGQNSRARFGLAVAGLGDINLDGFGDFAVGAPYDGFEERGVVYIFHGSANGVRDKPSQIIQATDVYQASLSTFGFSLSGGMDLDGNQYNDLIVGAYESDAAVFFRSRPVVKMTAAIEFVSDSNFISLDEKKCTLFGKRKKVPCVTLKYCLKYDGIGVDNLTANGYICSLDFSIRLILDSLKPQDPRVFLLNTENQYTMNRTLTIDKKNFYCDNTTVYIKDNIKDKLTPIEVDFQYFMITTSRYEDFNRRRNPRSVLTPILDQNVINSQKASINIQNDCGPDNICIPDLQLIAETNVKDYLLGTKAPLIINVIVENRGEDAFEATYNVDLPPGVNFVNINKTGDNNIVQCSPVRNFNNSLRCDLGNPLPKEKVVQFDILLEPFYKRGMPLHYNFKMYANSSNPESSLSANDNKKEITVNIWVETKFEIESISNPPELHYNASLYLGENMTNEVDVGPHLIHKYTFKNKGVSTINKAEIFVAWPYETEAGDDLMYVVDYPLYSDELKCEAVGHINYLNLMVDQKLREKFMLEVQSFSNGESSEYSAQNSGSGMKSETTQGFNSNISGGSVVTESKGSNYSHTSWTSKGNSGINGGRQTFIKEDGRTHVNVDNEQKIKEMQGSYGAHASGGQRNFSKQWSYNSTGGSQWSSEKEKAKSGSASWSGQEGQTYVGGENKRINNFDGIRHEGEYYGKEIITHEGEHHSGAEGKSTLSKGMISGQREQHSGENVNRGKQGSTSYNTYYTQTGQGNRDANWGTYQGTPSVGTQNRSYVTSWSMNSTGSGPTKVYKSTQEITNVNGRVSKTESTTEYYLSEHDENRITNTRINEGTFNTGGTQYYGMPQGQNSGIRYYHETDGDGGTVRYGSGSYSSGGAKQYQIGRNQNVSGNQAFMGNWNSGRQSSTSGVLDKWSTQEAVNKDLINANSQNFNLNGRSSSGIGIQGTGIESTLSGEGFRTNALDLGIINPRVNEENQKKMNNNFRGGSQYSKSSSYETKWEDSDRPAEYFKWDHSRNRRQAQQQKEDINEIQLRNAIRCSGLKCAVLRCVTGPLETNEKVHIALRSRVNARTLKKLVSDKPIKLTSVGVIRVLELPFIGIPEERPPHVQEAVSLLTPMTPLQPAEPVPLWVVVLSACAGTALLLLLIYALYKCEFFKRNRPEAPERQPLNRNGYGHGDEQL